MINRTDALGMISSSSGLRRRLGWGRTIGIFIELDGLQLATAAQFFTGGKLLDTRRILLPKKIHSENERRTFFLETINQYINKFGRGRTRYLLGVEGQETAFRLLSLPRMPRRELAEAVFWEGNRRIPFGLEYANFCYRIIDNKRSPDREKMTVSLTAVSHKEIENLLDFTSPLGIEFEAINHIGEATGQLLGRLQPVPRNNTHALLNLRRNYAQICYYGGTQLEFIHGFNMKGGGNAYGIPEGDDTGNFDHLFNEIQNSLDFFTGQFSARAVEKMFIAGSYRYCNELAEWLSSALGITCEAIGGDNLLPADAGKNGAGSLIESSGAAALALAEYNMMNFLPGPRRQKKALRTFYRLSLPALALFIALLLAAWSSMKYKNEIIKGELTATLARIESLQSSPSYAAYRLIKQHLNADSLYREQRLSRPTHLHLNLKELSLKTPRKVRLYAYDLRNGLERPTLTIGGRAMSANPPPEIVLAEFIAGLEKSPFYENVRLRRHSKHLQKGVWAVDFEIEMETVI